MDPVSAGLAPLGLFITGTDTEIGKTLVSTAMLRGCATRGWRAAALKPIAAGAAWRDGAWHNDDVDLLAAAANVTLPSAISNPYLLKAAAAPHIAAAQDGVTLDISQILACYRAAREQADIVVVEGVGGFRVPLDDALDTADLAVALNLPVLLVVGMRLGCINHALLTAEAIAARGLVLAGWVANRIDPAMAFADQNIAALRERFANQHDAPLLGVIPNLQTASADDAAPYLDIDTLLRTLRSTQSRSQT